MRLGRTSSACSQARAVQTPRPGEVAGAVVLLGPLASSSASAFAVASSAGASRRAPSCAGGARPWPPGLNPSVHPRSLQPPADVHVVAGGPELRVEAADRLAARLRGRPCCSRGCARPRWSESRTWIGPPGALATHSATGPSPGGGMFGPPTPTCAGRREGVQPGTSASAGRGRRRRRCRRRSRRSRPRSPMLRARLSPRFSVADEPEAVLARRSSPSSSVEPSLTTITSKSGYSSRQQALQASRMVRAPL